MTRLCDLAHVLRSKNSGPYAITLDILFDNDEAYHRVLKSGAITPQSIALIYGIPLSHITHFAAFDAALGIKITFLRAISSGTAGDRDVYGAQQHAPLMEVMIP